MNDEDFECTKYSAKYLCSISNDSLACKDCLYSIYKLLDL